MRYLLACTCLTPLFAFAGAAQAERVIDTAVTAPVRTATAANGAADDIRITTAGSIKLTAGTAVTLDSNDDVKNEGTIEIKNANDSVGILGEAGRTGNISHTGKISIVEDYDPKDTDNDGDVDGAFAQGARRFGIRIAPGGVFTGNVTGTGTMDIEGNDSAGIALDSRLNGSLTTSNSSAIVVIGDRSTGIRAGDVNGAVTIRGSVSARGKDSIGVALDGDIGGALLIQSSIASTGYRATTAPADTSKLDADDLLQGGPALRISGNVGGGIILAIAPKDTKADDKDEDKDGVEDAVEGNASVVSYGAAPAVQIGSATEAVNVGAVVGQASGHGLVIDGAVAGRGIYKGVNASGLVIGGLGGDVMIAGGMTVNGSVGAESNGKDATAIRIGNRATVNEIRIGGTVAAAGGVDEGATVQAIRIDQGANVATIRNTGTISASAGSKSNAGAIVDLAGTVTLVENKGTISAVGGSSTAGSAVAIDLRANNSGATVRQTKVEQGAAGSTLRTSGDILFGAGNDVLEVAGGSVIGAVRFGAGANRFAMSADSTYSGAVQFGTGADRLSLSGSSILAGSVDFGGGADVLEIGGTARLSGSLTGTGGLAVQISGGTLDASNLGTVALSSLSVTGTGAIGVNIDGAAGTTTLYNVAGAASFGPDSEVRVRLANVSEAEGRYVFLRAGSLTGSAGLGLTATSLPFLFKGSVQANDQQGEAAVVIERKTAAELGLNRSEAAAYGAIFDVLDSDEDVADVFLEVRDADLLRRQIRQMLPDHAGGAFETVTQGSRATARFLADPNAPFADFGRWGFWLQQVGWGTSKDLGDTAGYDISGWGASGGAEIITEGAGNFGASFGYLAGSDGDNETSNEVHTDQLELAAYWRGQWGGLRLHARGSAAFIQFDGNRVFQGTDGTDNITRTATGSWDGQLYSASAGASYEVQLGRLSLRPLAAVDYYKLKEDGYTEKGGGEAFNLIVDDRSSDEFAATASLTAGYDFMAGKGDSMWLRGELEGGRREIVGGSLGATTAHFEDGDPFTLEPEDRTSGWIGRLRLIGGSSSFTIGGEASAEEQQGRAAVAFRVSAGLGF